MPEGSLINDAPTRYQLNLIYLLDTSGSMGINNNAPIGQLNAAMSEAVRIAEEVALKNEIQLFMRVVEFNTVAKWIFGDTRHGVEHIDWVELTANGGTDTAGAIELAQSVMHREILGVRNYRPVVILITDGESNDPQRTIEAVEKLKGSLKSSDPNKKTDKITRIAIGVTGANQDELRNFASVGNIEHDDGTTEENVPYVFNVDNVQMLKALIKGVTVSSIASSIGGGDVDRVITDGPTLQDPSDGGVDPQEWI